MVSINDGFSEKAISAKRHCSKTAVHIAIANFNKYWNYKGLNRRGRPMKTLPRNDRMMKQITVPFPTSSLKKIRATLLRKGTDVHMTTVFRRLRF